MRPVTWVLLGLVALSVAHAEFVPVTFAPCPSVPGAPTGSFVVQSVTATNTTIAPAGKLSFLVSGTLTEAFTDGIFNLRAVVNGATDVDEQFGPLHTLLTTPMPTPAQPTFGFDWTAPGVEKFATDEKQIVLELNAYSQALTPITCVQVTMSLSVPAEPDTKSTSKILGYMCALISVFFFGTNFLFVKAYDTGDGVFFQWCLCIGIWLCGLVVQFIRNSPPFEPLAMVGGMMWAIGNCTTVPIIGMIGLGVGMCLWGTAGLVMGWACGRFGFFGLKVQAVENQAMNYIGLLLCVASMAIMFTVKSVKEEREAAAQATGAKEALLPDDSLNLSTANLMENGDHADSSDLIAMRRKTVNSSKSSYDSASTSPAQTEPVREATWTDRLSPATRRVCGISLALFAGCLYGLNFSPPQYLIDSGKGSSSHGIDYVFSHFTGILTTSTAYMITYSFYSRNKPWVSPSIILPGIASGMGWAIAQINWFVANDQIHFVGTFPLVSCGPGIVATLCAIVFYREIQGTKNYLSLLAAAVVTFIGVILIAFSLPAGS